MKLYVCHYHSRRTLKSGRTRWMYRHIIREARELPSYVGIDPLDEVTGTAVPLWARLVDFHLWKAVVRLDGRDQFVVGFSFDEETAPVYWLRVGFSGSERTSVTALLRLWLDYNQDVVLPPDIAPKVWTAYLSLAGLHRGLRYPHTSWAKFDRNDGKTEGDWQNGLDPIYQEMEVKAGEQVLDFYGNIGTAVSVDSEGINRYEIRFDDGARESTNRATPLRLIEELGPENVPAEILQRMAAVEEVSHG